MARTEVTQEQIDEAQKWVPAELSNFERIEKEYGSRFWARAVGSKLVGCMVLAMDYPESTNSTLIGRAIIKSLKPLIERAKADPELAQEFVAGMKEEMESRRFFNEPRAKDEQSVSQVV